MITDAITYPVRRSGLVMIFLGSIVSLLLQIAKHVPLLGIGAAVFSAGYFTAFYFDIISTSAGGGDGIPDWPDFSDFLDDILLPFFRIVAVIFVSFAVTAVVPLTLDEANPWYWPAMWAALALACMYYPMAVLGVVVFGGVKGCLPHIVIPGIFKSLPGYLLTVLTLVVIFGISTCAQVFAAQIPYAGWLLTTALSLYALMFQARYIGLFYRAKRDNLGWE